ncbi:DNA alkylation repair protein [Geodermatophilus sp. SYSU D00758]
MRTAVCGAAVAEVMAELAALEDPRIREVNARHGDDHGVNPGSLRALAKRLKTQPELARDLWATGDSAARLLAILTCRPKVLGRTSWTPCCAGRGPPRCTTGW